MSAGLRAVLKSGVGAARYRLTGHRAPLNVAIALTNRCDALCAYCPTPMRAGLELETHEWLGVIDHVAAIGAARVGFGGGEPLARRDFEVLLSRCREHGLITTLETNGHQLPARLAGLGSVERVLISYDGPEKIHDRGRERGSWAKAVAGIDAAVAAGHDVSTVTVLGAHDLDAIDHVLDRADAWKVGAIFQVLQPRHRGSKRLVPDDASLRTALARLLDAKRAGRRVAMSERALQYLLAWPDFSRSAQEVPHEDMLCMAGQIYCAIDADGGVYPCLPRTGLVPVGNVRTDGFDAAFARLRDNSCRACTSTACTEYNFLYNLDGSTVLSLARSLAPGGST